MYRYLIPKGNFPNLIDALVVRDIIEEVFGAVEKKTVRENGKCVGIVVGTAKPIPEADLRELGLSGALSEGSVRDLLAGNLPTEKPQALAA